MKIKTNFALGLLALVAGLNLATAQSLEPVADSASVAQARQITPLRVVIADTPDLQTTLVQVFSPEKVSANAKARFAWYDPNGVPVGSYESGLGNVDFIGLKQIRVPRLEFVGQYRLDVAFFDEKGLMIGRGDTQVAIDSGSERLEILSPLLIREADGFRLSFDVRNYNLAQEVIPRLQGFFMKDGERKYVLQRQLDPLPLAPRAVGAVEFVVQEDFPPGEYYLETWLESTTGRYLSGVAESYLQLPGSYARLNELDVSMAKNTEGAVDISFDGYALLPPGHNLRAHLIGMYQDQVVVDEVISVPVSQGYFVETMRVELNQVVPFFTGELNFFWEDDLNLAGNLLTQLFNSPSLETMEWGNVEAAPTETLPTDFSAWQDNENEVLNSRGLSHWWPLLVLAFLSLFAIILLMRWFAKKRARKVFVWLITAGLGLTSVAQAQFFGFDMPFFSSEPEVELPEPPTTPSSSGTSSSAATQTPGETVALQKAWAQYNRCPAGYFHMQVWDDSDSIHSLGEDTRNGAETVLCVRPADPQAQLSVNWTLHSQACPTGMIDGLLDDDKENKPRPHNLNEEDYDQPTYKWCLGVNEPFRLSPRWNFSAPNCRADELQLFTTGRNRVHLSQEDSGRTQAYCLSLIKEDAGTQTTADVPDVVVPADPTPPVEEPPVSPPVDPPATTTPTTPTTPPATTASCDANVWSPDTSLVCSFQTFTQTNECGDTREVQGTLDCAVSWRWLRPTTPAPLVSASEDSRYTNVRVTGDLNYRLAGQGFFAENDIRAARVMLSRNGNDYEYRVPLSSIAFTEQSYDFLLDIGALGAQTPAGESGPVVLEDGAWNIEVMFEHRHAGMTDYAWLRSGLGGLITLDSTPPQIDYAHKKTGEVQAEGFGEREVTNQAGYLWLACTDNGLADCLGLPEDRDADGAADDYVPFAVKGNFCADGERCDNEGVRTFEICDRVDNCSNLEVELDHYDPVSPRALAFVMQLEAAGAVIGTNVKASDDYYPNLEYVDPSRVAIATNPSVVGSQAYLTSDNFTELFDENACGDPTTSPFVLNETEGVCQLRLLNYPPTCEDLGSCPDSCPDGYVWNEALARCEQLSLPAYTGTWTANTAPSCPTTCGQPASRQVGTVTCSDGNCDPLAEPAPLTLDCAATVTCGYTGTWTANTAPSCPTTCRQPASWQVGTVTCSDGNCDPTLEPNPLLRNCSATAACGGGSETCTPGEFETDAWCDSLGNPQCGNIDIFQEACGSDQNCRIQNLRMGGNCAVCVATYDVCITR